MRGARLTGGVALFLACLPAWCEVLLADRATLEEKLRAAGPCCVVDARAPSHRDEAPIANAVIYVPGKRIQPTAAVVVVADSDARALQVAGELVRSSGAATVLAVKGGQPVWSELLRARAASGAYPAVFTIPRNTCEQGEPLQILRAK